MVSSPGTIHPTPRNTTYNDALDAHEPAVMRFLLAGVKNAYEIDFEETNVAAFFEKKNYKVHVRRDIIKHTKRDG